jgi:alkylation response protein AidB-like acyl-CoA dehydrogenase
MDAESNPPQHIPYSPFGKRVDEIKVSHGWKMLDALSAEEGIIQLGYDPNNKSSGRIHQFLKIFLYHPSSAFYTCPLAMTDGAAKLIEVFLKTDLGKLQKENLEKAYAHLTTRDPEHFWTSGQWMTEKTGGSDVAISQTRAKRKGDFYQLYGTKWFTSATTSQMCFTLARIEDESGNVTEGSKGLSLFYVELRDDEGNLKNMSVRRLKDKLGTKALPTAEVDLEGTPALLIGNPGEGIKNISHLFNITRIYNAVTTVGSFRRLLQLADDYSEKRVAFGKKLCEQPLHKKILKEAHEAFSKCFILTFSTVSLLQKEESLHNKGEADQEVSTLLRLFTPLAKLYTAKMNMMWTSELVESFGGAGYIEDTGIPRFLRDSQVLTIWEGTTNVLSLDCLRAIQKENALEVFLKKIPLVAKENGNEEAVIKRLGELKSFIKELGTDQEKWQYHAREFAFELCEIAVLAFKPPAF